MSGKSTSTALQDFMLFATNCINDSKCCSALYIDLSKAFDSLNHSLLLYKMRDYGIRNKSGPWFESYLNCRKQKTLFNSNESSLRCIQHGVPQGSTLGPLLYILYVNDCFKKVTNNTSEMIMYADDTVLLSTGVTVDIAVLNSQIFFNEYVDWTNKNQLTINVNKTKHMIISSRNKNVCFNTTIRKVDENVGKTQLYTYLGVAVDNNLNFESFLKSIIQKVNFKLYLFSKIRYLLTFNAAIMVYKQMVLPFFDYMDILIDAGPKKYIDKLQQLQFRGIQIIYQYHFEGRRIKNSDKTLLQSSLSLMELRFRRKKHLLQMMYGLKSRKPNLVEHKNRSMTLRSDKNIAFRQDKLNSEIFVKAPHVRDDFLWKQLPSEVQHAKTKKEFDNLLTDRMILNLKC